MKITEKNTAIGLLDKMDLSSFTISEDADKTPLEYKRAFAASLVGEWHKIAPAFVDKIQYISDPFYKAYDKSVGKLAPVFFDQDIDESGTFISRASPSETNTIFYNILATGKGENYKLSCIILFFSNNTKDAKPCLNIFINRSEKGVKEYFSEVATRNGLTNISICADLMTMILFMKYVDLETKFVNGGRKDHHAGVKYVNDTKRKIEILDSHWFTTIVRSEGFEVTGHFRLQPYKDGKKLIWIEKFDKKGYTRTAKIAGGGAPENE